MNLLINGEDNQQTIILAHGAGAPMDHYYMEAFAEGLAERGIKVVRFNFPYMEERATTGAKRPPNPAKVLIQTWKDVIADLGGPENLIIGGKSMGGRIASMIADEMGVKGLACLGYPFHPPGKPEKTRTDHLGTLKTPTLICQGTRDALGNKAAVEGYSLSDTIRLHWLEDGDHGFKPRVKSGRTEEENFASAMDAIKKFAETL